MNIFRNRRIDLFDCMGADSVAIIASGRHQLRNRDSHFPFRVDSDFWYLTGFDEPESILVLEKRSGKTKTHIFVRPKDDHIELWNGKLLGVEVAAEHLQIDSAYQIDKFASMLQGFLQKQQQVFSIFGQEQIALQLQQFFSAHGSGRKTESYPQVWQDLSQLLHEQRLHKQPEELEYMRESAMISSLGHMQMMRKAKPGIYEYQLAACMYYESMMQGAQYQAYSPIVASGENACILHYTENTSCLQDGQMVLIDAGCEHNYYAADITRTFPVSGRFSGWQKDLYSLVLLAQKSAIEQSVVGATLEKVHNAAVEVICDGLIDWGIFSESRDQVIEQKLYTRYFMHGTSHWLGLDVHDVGNYSTDGNSRKLATGMVITVEPGIYIAKNDNKVPSEWRGTGIRIEDDIHITDNQPEVITIGAPKEIDDMEAIIGVSTGYKK